MRKCCPKCLLMLATTTLLTGVNIKYPPLMLSKPSSVIANNYKFN